VRVLALALAAAVALGPAVPGARADADPPSDVLFVQDHYLPYTPVARPFADALKQLVRETRRAGFPLKVVVIAAKDDLGAVPQYLGRPRTYARFLLAEIAYQRHQPLLVVQRAGFGSGDLGRAARALDGQTVDAAHGTNGLVRSAVLAGQRIAAAAGHPVAPVGMPSLPGEGGGTSPWWLVAAGVAVAAALWGLRAARRARTTQPAPEASSRGDIGPT
jgi:hypothetical protein